jgi:hypothetical protein
MIGAAGIKSGLALGARVVAREVLRDAQSMAAIAAENSLGATLGFTPNNRGVASSFIMALDAGVKGIAALEFDGYYVALRVVMGALGTLVHAGAVTNDGRGGPDSVLMSQSVLLVIRHSLYSAAE